MIRRFSWCLGTTVVAVLCLFQVPTAAQDPVAFEAGFSERDITPEIGMEVPGGYSKAYAKEIHDPCKVRAAVFGDGKSRVALVSIDGGFIFRPAVEKARAEIEKRCGIPGDAVLIGATHSHSSGPLGIVQPGEYDHASDFVQTLAYEKSSAADPAYLALMHEQTVAAVCEADKNRETARAGVGSGVVEKIAFNRRLRMKGGVTFTHPGQGNPDILDYAGPTDPEVSVLGAWNAKGELAGCIVNFACHATTSPPGISANYVYYLEKAIRGFYGEKVIVVFLPGYSGDVTQVDNLSPYANPDGDRWAKIVGGSVGAEAVKTLLAMEPGVLLPLDARSKILDIPHRVPSRARVEEAYQVVRGDPNQTDPTTWAFAKETVLLDALLQKSKNAAVEVQAIQIGPAVFLTSPGEMFCQYQLEQKKQSPFPMTFCISVANGFNGYVPTEEAFGAQGGGYETRLTSCSNLEIGAGPKIVQTGLNLAGQMKPGAIPARPKARPFRQPWSYGNVPPQVN
jgi:neutral ceramidase